MFAHALTLTGFLLAHRHMEAFMVGAMDQPQKNFIFCQNYTELIGIDRTAGWKLRKIGNAQRGKLKHKYIHART